MFDELSDIYMILAAVIVLICLAIILTNTLVLVCCHYPWYRKHFREQCVLKVMYKHLKICSSKKNLVPGLKRLYRDISKFKFFVMHHFSGPVFFICDTKILKELFDSDLQIYHDETKNKKYFFERKNPTRNNCRLAEELYHSQYKNATVRKNMRNEHFTNQSDLYSSTLYCINQLCLHIERIIEIPIEEREKYRVAYSMEKYVAYLIKTGIFVMEIDKKKKIRKDHQSIPVCIERQEIIHKKPNIFCRFLLIWHKCGTMFILYLNNHLKGLTNFICGERNIFSEMCEFFNDTINRIIVSRKSNLDLNKPDNLLKLIICPNPQRDMEDMDWYFAPHGYRQEMNVAAEYAIMAFDEGFATISTTLTFLLYELAKNPEIQDILYESLSRVIHYYEYEEDALDEYAEIPYHAILLNDYLNACVKEILRKYPPKSYYYRVTKMDYDLSEVKCKLWYNTHIYYSTLGAHHDPKNYANPLQFDPRRFVHGKNPEVYFPYKIGRQKVDGVELAEKIIKFTLANLVLKFKFSTIKGEIDELKFDKKHFIRQRYDIKINMVKRNPNDLRRQRREDSSPEPPTEPRSSSNMSYRSLESLTTSGRVITEPLPSVLEHSDDSGHPSPAIPMSSTAATIRSSLSTMPSQSSHIVIVSADYHAPVSGINSNEPSPTLNDRRKRSLVSNPSIKSKSEILAHRKMSQPSMSQPSMSQPSMSQPSTSQQQDQSINEDYNHYMSSLLQRSTSRYRPPLRRASQLPDDIEMSVLNSGHHQMDSQQQLSGYQSSHVAEIHTSVDENNQSNRNAEFCEADKNKTNEQSNKKQHDKQQQLIQLRQKSQPQMHSFRETLSQRQRPSSSPNVSTNVNITQIPSSIRNRNQEPSTSTVIHIPPNVNNIHCSSSTIVAARLAKQPYHIVDIHKLQQQTSTDRNNAPKSQKSQESHTSIDRNNAPKSQKSEETQTSPDRNNAPKSQRSQGSQTSPTSPELPAQPITAPPPIVPQITVQSSTAQPLTAQPSTAQPSKAPTVPTMTTQPSTAQSSIAQPSSGQQITPVSVTSPTSPTSPISQTSSTSAAPSTSPTSPTSQTSSAQQTTPESLTSPTSPISQTSSTTVAPSTPPTSPTSQTSTTLPSSPNSLNSVIMSPLPTPSNIPNDGLDLPDTESPNTLL